MIKRIIFDLDDTLIKWEEHYYNVIEETLQEFNISYNKETLYNIMKTFMSYEKHYSIYSIDNYLGLINTNANLQLDKTAVNRLLEKIGHCVPKELDTNLKSTLDYLSSKYELVILTNWFREVQVNRLKNYNIMSYFKEVYAGDKALIKPNKEAYLNAIGDNKTEECIMIGDNLELDVIAPIKFGLKAIHFNAKKETFNDNYIHINSIIELKELL